MESLVLGSNPAHFPIEFASFSISSRIISALFAKHYKYALIFLQVAS